MSGKQLIGFILGLGSLLLGIWAPFESLEPRIQLVLGLVLFAVIFWTSEPIPLELSSLVLLLLFPALDLLSFYDSFSPFAGKTLWLVFAGMVLSLGITETGLGERLAEYLMRHLGRSPARLLLHLHLIGLVASLMVPSGLIRILLLMPIGIAVVDYLGNRQAPLLNAAVLLSLLCSTYYGGCGVLTGSVPNLVVAGQLEKFGYRVVYWGEWLRWMFPVIGLLRTGLCFAVIWFLLGRKIQPESLRPRTPPRARRKFDPLQCRVLLILLLGVALWSTDFLHQLAPVYVALGLVLLYTLPRWGAISFADIRKVNFPFLFYIAAMFSLGTSVEASGFNKHFIELVSDRLPLDYFGLPASYLVLSLMVVPLDFLMDIAAVAGVILPPMLALGQSHHMATLPVALSVAMATSLVFLPYQAAPFMVAYSYRRFSMGTLVLVMMTISLLSLLILFPLNVLYWHWTGLI